MEMIHFATATMVSLGWLVAVICMQTRSLRRYR